MPSMSHLMAACILLIGLFISASVMAAKPAAQTERLQTAHDLYRDLGLTTPMRPVEAPAYTINDLQGVKRSLSDHKGKVILLNFWATWCPPCREEMPAMQRMWERYKDQGFVIIAPSADYDAKLAEDYLKEYGLTFPALHDPAGDLSNLYGVEAFPMSFLINHKGMVEASVVGRMEWDTDEAIFVVEHLLENARKDR